MEEQFDRVEREIQEIRREFAAFKEQMSAKIKSQFQQVQQLLINEF